MEPPIKILSEKPGTRTYRTYQTRNKVQHSLGSGNNDSTGLPSDQGVQEAESSQLSYKFSQIAMHLYGPTVHPPAIHPSGPNHSPGL